MARIHGKDWSTISLAGTSIKADCVGFDINPKANTHDTTTIGDSWIEKTAGLKDGDAIKFDLFYENTSSTGTWALFTNNLGGASVAFSAGDGTRTISCQVIVTECPLPVKVNEMVKFTPTVQVTGAVTFA